MEPIETTLPDGLYQIATLHICAAFIVKDGYIVDCAPILRGRIDRWQTIATRVADDSIIRRDLFLR